MAKTAARDPLTSYAVGSATASRGHVFTDYFLPGGRKVRIIDKDVFDGAVRKSGEILAEFSSELRAAGKAPERVT